MDLGWIPHDDGTLAHAAGRVLDGELPHRDFDDVYTGGQALLHAAAFALLGESLLTLRLVLFGALTLTTAVTWRIARRFAAPLPAALVTSLAVLWSVPAYPAAMPSWYNLFLAILSVGVLLRFHDTRRRRWLLAAGACAGVSVTIKVVGLYLVAAALLALVFLEQEEGTAPGTAPDAASGAAPPGRASHLDAAPTGRAFDPHRLGVTAGLLAFSLALARLLAPSAGTAAAPWFLLPPLALVALLLGREWSRAPARPWRTRTGTLLRWGLPFLAGVAVPVAIFLVPYALTGSLDALARGALVVPARRTSETLFLRPPEGWFALPMAALVALVLVAARGRRADRRAAVALALPLLVVVAGAASPPLYRAGWWLLLPLVPGVVAGGVARLLAGGTPAPADRFLLLAATAMVGLVGYPTFVPVYVFYVAPLAALAVLALASPLGDAPRWTLGLLLAFHLAFAALWVDGAGVYWIGERWVAHPPPRRLALPRGGLRVEAGEAEAYERLAEALDAVESGPWLWATPDAPEVYFLTGRRNAGRTLFDVFDGDLGDPAARTARVEALLESRDVRAVVVKRSPTAFSPRPSPTLMAMVRRRYPRALDLGTFVVFVAPPSPGDGSGGEGSAGAAGGRGAGAP